MKSQNPIMFLGAFFLFCLLVCNTGCEPVRTCFGPTAQFKPECSPPTKSDGSGGDHHIYPEQQPDDEEREAALCLPMGKMQKSVIFVTSKKFQGDFGGLKEADKICKEHAQAANLPGNFVAWLGSNGHSPANRREFCSLRDAATQFIRTDGQLLANGWDSLTNENLLTDLSRDEFGERTDSLAVWTNLTADGHLAESGEDCNDWTSASPDLYGWTGAPNAYGRWSDNRRKACSNELPFYCVQVGVTIPITANNSPSN